VLQFTVGSVLIFVTRKVNSEELANSLRHNDFQGAYVCKFSFIILMVSFLKCGTH